jgi:hypothetical protein
MTAPATIVSCLYGNRDYERFIDRWDVSIHQLTTQPEDVIVATDREYVLPFEQRVSECQWRNPQAFYLHDAIMAATSEWVWILDIDDLALPDALEGLEIVDGDVWQMGYQTDDAHGNVSGYAPPQLTAEEYLDQRGNPFTAGSAVRTEAFWRCGGFPDVAFQDFALWRRLALQGARFVSSGRCHYRYTKHPDSRSAVELTTGKRAMHLAEMIESENTVAH